MTEHLTEHDFMKRRARVGWQITTCWQANLERLQQPLHGIYYLLSNRIVTVAVFILETHNASGRTMFGSSSEQTHYRR